MEIIQILLLLVIVGLLVNSRQQKAIRSTGKTRKLLMDSSGLIDGRILQLTKAGFITSELVVPQFILKELQLLADGNDSRKRERARFGLDVVKELQETNGIVVSIDRSEFSGPTDDRLVELAKKTGADLYTTDFNLNKLAGIEGIKVLNVNELVQNLRSIALPGESTSVKILQRGSNRNQGVGYLEDGTMIVVDNAARLMDKVVKAEVTRIHQTASGKMLFAQLLPDNNPEPTKPKLKFRQK